jgi:hypothetical protein
MVSKVVQILGISISKNSRKYVKGLAYGVGDDLEGSRKVLGVGKYQYRTLESMLTVLGMAAAMVLKVVGRSWAQAVAMVSKVVQILVISISNS